MGNVPSRSPYITSRVICGVTFSRSAAGRNETVTVLLATVWMGICTPWVISEAAATSRAQAAAR